MENRILVDSSSWIEFFKHPHSPATQLLQKLLNDDLVLMASPIYFEVIGGFRTENEAKKVAGLFHELDSLKLEEVDYHEAALMRIFLRKKGVQLQGMDLLIARLALKNSCQLLHQDSDYDRIARHLPLKILK